MHGAIILAVLAKALASVSAFSISQLEVLPDADVVALLQHRLEIRKIPKDEAFKRFNVTGDSTRIGNMLNAWYFANIPGYVKHNASKWEFEDLKSYQCDGDKIMCFGKFLGTEQPQITALPPEKLQALNNVMKNESTHDSMYHFPMSYPSVLKLMHADLANDIASQKRSYAMSFAPSLLFQPPSGHCVVHYRVGDIQAFASNGDTPTILSPQSVAAAVASFSPHPTTVEILNGGSAHCQPGRVLNCSNETIVSELKNRSAELLQELVDEIRLAVPTASVNTSFSGSPDEDWFKLSAAPMIVVTAGTFAASAAIANEHNQVRSPAARNYFEPQTTPEAPSTIRPGWTTFTFNVSSFW